MSRVIHKYLMQDLRATHRMPLGSQFLSVSKDPQSNVAMYFDVDPDEKQEETRTFWGVFTGRPVQDDSLFMGTLMTDGLMVHVFELFNRHLRKTIGSIKR